MTEAQQLLASMRALKAAMEQTILNDYYWNQTMEGPNHDLVQRGGKWYSKARVVHKTEACVNPKALNAFYNALGRGWLDSHGTFGVDYVVEFQDDAFFILDRVKKQYTPEELRELLKPWPKGMRELERLALVHAPQKWKMPQETEDDGAVREAIDRAAELF